MKIPLSLDNLPSKITQNFLPKAGEAQWGTIHIHTSAEADTMQIGQCNIFVPEWESRGRILSLF